jgi:tRNA(fMet)-specific endonuclease VapC
VTLPLDTDAVSHALRGEGRVAERLRAHRPSEIVVSAITVADLSYGVARSRTRRVQQAVTDFLGALTVAPFDGDAARTYGPVAARLVEAGVPIGTMDTLIAAHAPALRATLVSHDTKHFSRVHGLRLVDWY